jgi:glucose/arabinose dehydrogenase
MKWLQTLILGLTCALTFSTHAEIARDKDLNIEKVASGLNIPWGMAVIPDNHLLVTQRDQTLSRVDMNTGEIIEITGLPEDIRVGGQGGLFDIRLAPDYQDSGWIYLSYNKNVDGQGATTLSRARINGNQLVDWQDLIVTRSRTGNDVHFGGRIAFDGKGHVFLSLGDRGERENSQNLANHAGSILRLNLDGSVPEDNPFVGQDNALPEIWSYGHRNVQGLFYNTETDTLWAQEHGPRGGDEINLVKSGNNYGWPEISYGKEYWAPLAVGEEQKAGMEQPVKMYDPSIAPSGLIQYQGELFPAWQGKLLSGAMKLQHLNIVTLNKSNEAVDEKRLLRSLNSRIRNVIEAPDGAILVSTDAGAIYRLTPAN